MNLGKLLVAGKSIINGCAEISYRANRRVYLPRFGFKRNPFSPADAAKPDNPGAEPVAASAVKTGTTVAARTQKIPPWPYPAHVTSWARKLNPISKWRSPAPAAPAAPAASQPVQSELSLDAVKVVHNDLSDADVEVVPIKSRTVDKQDVPMLPPPEKPWEYLAERMFHATTD
jgi:hypothetical protein